MTVRHSAQDPDPGTLAPAGPCTPDLSALSTGRLRQVLDAIRSQWKANDDKRDAGLPTVIPEVDRYDDIPYPAADGSVDPHDRWHLLDVSLPSDRALDGRLPVIISIHGGGWFYGTKETYQFYAMHLAKAGFAVVNFNYRLPPQAQYPQELDDVNAVMHWAADPAVAEKYRFDTRNVFLVGDSAGGQMLMQYLACLTDAGYRAKFGYTVPNLTIRAAADNCGASFLTLPGMIANPTTAYFTPSVLAAHRDDVEFEKYLTPAIPPVFLMTASNDFLRDCTVRLDGFLRAKGISHEFHSYGTQADPRAHVFHVNVKDPLARRCNADEIAFFRRFMR